MADPTLFSGGTDSSNTLPQVKKKYPKAFVQTTSCGHSLEMNNTGEGERIRLLHGTNGNLINIDEKANNNFVSHNDTYVITDHNLVIKVGKDIKTDKACVQIIGNVNLYVEGDMHSEVEGNRYDTVNGNWEQKCNGVMSLRAEENFAITSQNQMKLKSNSYENKTTFLYNDLTEGGSIKEDVKGNYEVKIEKETATFSVKSQGDVRIKADMCRYDKVGGNYITDVGGKMRTNVDGNGHTCINGGAFDGMLSGPASASYDLNVTGDTNYNTSSNYVVNAGGDIDMDASNIYLN